MQQNIPLNPTFLGSVPLNNNNNNNTKISTALTYKDVQESINPIDFQQQSLPYNLLMKNGGDVMSLAMSNSKLQTKNQQPLLQFLQTEETPMQLYQSPPRSPSSAATGFNFEMSRRNSFGSVLDIIDRSDPLFEDIFPNSIQTTHQTSNTYQNKDLWFESPSHNPIQQSSSNSDMFFDVDETITSSAASVYNVPALVTSGAWIVDPNQQQGLVQPQLQGPLPLQNSALVDTNQLNAIIQELIMLRNAAAQTQNQLTSASIPNIIQQTPQQQTSVNQNSSNEKQKKKRGRVPKSEDTVLKTMPAPQVNIQIAPMTSSIVESSSSSINNISLIHVGEDGIERLGRYSLAERAEKIRQFQLQRNNRVFTKKIRYECRKNLADNRPRYKGRFCKTMPTEEEIRKEQEEKQRKAQEKREAKRAKKN